MRWLSLAVFSFAELGSCGSTESPPPPHGAVSSAVATACAEGSFAEGDQCVSFLATTCDVPAIPAPAAIELTTDHVYSTPHAVPQALDVARPVGASDRPVALFVHGGSWSGGDKRDHRDDIRRVAGLGWVGVAVNYRLVQHGQNRFPAGISDVRCAIRWVRAHADELGANGARIVAIGDSAGGELVELLGTEPDETKLDDGQCQVPAGSVSVDGVVSYYGRADLSMPPVLPYVVDYIGRDGDWAARDRLASAVDHVGVGTTPMLLVHGQVDRRVPVAQSRVLRDALRKAAVAVGLVEVPGADHGFPIFGTHGNGAMAACSTLAFLRHFR